MKIDDLSLKYENKERLLNFNFHRIRLQNLKKCAQNSGLNVLKLLKQRIHFFKLYKNYDQFDQTNLLIEKLKLDINLMKSNKYYNEDTSDFRKSNAGYFGASDYVDDYVAEHRKEKDPVKKFGKRYEKNQKIGVNETIDYNNDKQTDRIIEIGQNMVGTSIFDTGENFEGNGRKPIVVVTSKKSELFY